MLGNTDWFERLMLVTMAIFVIALVVCVVVLVHDCQERDECQSNGGRVVEYNCHQVITCSTVGKMTNCYPHDSCEWRCEAPDAGAR